MKNFALVSSLLVAFAAPSWGITINSGPSSGTNVGSVDTYIAETTGLANSNPTTETAWVNSVLAPTTVTFFVKDEPVTYYSTDTANTYAFSMSSTEEYFVIKNAKFWALYENLNNLSWGVFDTSFLVGKFNLPSDGFSISHVSQFDSGSTPVPAPSTALLLGAGLLGFGLYSRKRRAK